MERLEIIETLKHMPDRVEQEVAGLPESVLRFKPDEQSLSIKEVIGHLRDAAQVWDKRFYMVWSQTDPVLPDFPSHKDVREANYQEADLSALIEDMRQARLKSVDLLAHAVDWTRLGQLRGIGRRTLKQMAEMLIADEARHLEEVRALKQRAQQGAAT